MDTQTERVVIEGEAKGADKSAGVIRNQEMLDKGKPDIVLIFHPNIFDSKGSADMYKRAVSQGFLTYLINK